MPKAPDPCAGFSPLVRQVVSLVGRRSDDPELVAFFTKTLGKNPPATKRESSFAKNVVAPKHGLEFAFDHDVKHDLYPLVPKTKKSFVPYLIYVWLTDKFPEPLPFDLAHGLEPDEITKRLGVPPTERGYGEYHRAFWSLAVDAPRAIVFSADAKSRILRIDEAGKLSLRSESASPVVGLFVAWAAQHGLLDAARVGAHATLLEGVRTGTRMGSELLAAAYPRGLWDVHLIDRPGLRRFAYQWFHNIGGVFIRDDLVAVFGGRKGPYGHEEPVLDADDAAAVKRATPKLDATFAPWLE
jgi:hypothetical protein